MPVSDLDALIAHIGGIWPNLTVLLPESDDRYQSLPLCIVDAVYSIGVRYESTERTVDDFCKWSHWNYQQEYTVTELIALLDPFDGDWERLAAEVFRNRQRTSSRSGILKAEAVYRFARGCTLVISNVASISRKRLDSIRLTILFLQLRPFLASPVAYP